MKDATVTILLSELDELRDFKKAIEQDESWVTCRTDYRDFWKSFSYLIKKDEAIESLRRYVNRLENDNSDLRIENRSLEKKLKEAKSNKWYEFWK